VPDTALIRAATAADAAALARIYDHYVAHTIVTFEEAAVGADEMAARLAETAAASLPWLVADTPTGVRGYAHASRWKGRCAYRHSAEVTVYVEDGYAGQGLGSQLYAALFPQLAALGCHVLIGGIALPNAASIALHEKFGLRRVGLLSEVGFKFGRWIDVGYWQLTLPAQPLPTP
jgi:L-amino acid N-acyltransferase YncA